MDSLNNNIPSSNFNFINLYHQNLREQEVSLNTAHLNTEVYNLKLVYAREITEIRNSNPPVEPDEFEATLNRVDTEVRIGISNGICAVTARKCEAIDILFGKIDGELKNMANETVDRYSGNITYKSCGHTEESVAYGALRRVW